MKTQYALLTLVYVLAWTLQFSRLEGGVYLIIGLLAALSYGIGQVYEWRFRGHLGLSADPVAITSAAVITAITTSVFVMLGRLPSVSTTYLDIVSRFLTALVVGHIAGFSSSFVMGKLLPRVPTTVPHETHEIHDSQREGDPQSPCQPSNPSKDLDKR